MPSPLDPHPSQAPVLDHDRGAMLVTGPPGSGKTTLLRERFARLIEAGGSPERVALFVLNRRAARDARDHLVRRLARSLPDLPVFTAHGFGFRVLGRRFEELGYSAPPGLLSAPEQYAFVRELLDAESEGGWPRHGRLLRTPAFAKHLADFVLRAQERLLDADGLDELVRRSDRPEYAEVAAFYRRYLEALARGDRVDFAALLLQTVTLLERDLRPEEAYEHVLVDDYQDATPAMEGILRSLGRAARTVTVAADPGGHVFSFQGGSLEPLHRLDRTLERVRRVELADSPRLGARASMLPPLDDPEAPDADVAPPGIEVRRFNHPGEEAEAVAHELLRARVDEDVPWQGMAVIVRRYGEYLTALRHALARHGVPFVVVAEAAAVATEPANRPVIDLFRYVYRPNLRDDLLERLLLTPLCGLDPHEVRRLRREAHLQGRTLRTLMESNELVPADLMDGVARFRSLIQDVPEVERERGPDGAFFWLWSTQPCFSRMVDAPERHRDVDALSALGHVLSQLVERRPGATIEDYLDTLEAAEFGPDPWILPEERYPNAVRIVSAHRAHGQEFEVAVVVGCLEGEFPSIIRGEPLFDVTRLTSPRTARRRLRDRLAEERALFRLAVSRGRRTVLTASHSSSARNPRTPSRFAARIGLTWDREAIEVPVAASLRAMESSLRRTLASAAAPPPERLAALAVLPAVGAAPAAWWGGRDWTDPGVPLHEGDIRTSYSRFSSLENCNLQYLFSVEMGLDTERSHSMWLGSLIHDIVDRVQRGELERSYEAMAAELDRAWKPEEFPNAALERQRRLDSERMLHQFLADEGQGELLASEEGFEFRLDGATVRGRIDALFRFGEGGVRVVDYKTSKNATSHDQTQRSLQLASYFLAMRRVPELAGLGRPELLELAFLFVEGKDGGYIHREVRPDRIFDTVAEYEEWAEATILELLQDVREERFAPSPEADCMWCSFKPICPLWPQGQEVTT